jgi:hypothetical protein
MFSRRRRQQSADLGGPIARGETDQSRSTRVAFAPRSEDVIPSPEGIRPLTLLGAGQFGLLGVATLATLNRAHKFNCGGMAFCEPLLSSDLNRPKSHASDISASVATRIATQPIYRRRRQQQGSLVVVVVPAKSAGPNRGGFLLPTVRGGLTRFLAVVLVSAAQRELSRLT